MKHYNSSPLNEFFKVSDIVEISYRGIPGEMIIDKHIEKDFWCLYYVDRGCADFFMEDGSVIELSSGRGLFFAPVKSFSYSRARKEGANILSVFFVCESLNIEIFNLRKHKFDTFERMILSELVNMGRAYFERHSTHPDGPKGTRPKEGAPEYVPHLVKASIEFLLLRLYKNKMEKHSLNTSSEFQNNLTVNEAVEFMYKNVRKKLNVVEIAASVKMSESNFRAVFKKVTGQSVISYFNNLKVEQAKIMIRKQIYTCGEIASELGFSSESYFSRHFKKNTGMTPSEYARLIYYG